MKIQVTIELNDDSDRREFIEALIREADKMPFRLSRIYSGRAARVAIALRQLALAVRMHTDTNQ